MGTVQQATTADAVMQDTWPLMPAAADADALRILKECLHFFFSFHTIERWREGGGGGCHLRHPQAYIIRLVFTLSTEGICTLQMHLYLSVQSVSYFLVMHCLQLDSIRASRHTQLGTAAASCHGACHSA